MASRKLTTLNVRRTAKLDKKKNRIYLSFDFDRDTIKMVKGLPGVKYKAGKYSLLLLYKSVKLLKDYGFDFNKSLHRWYSHKQIKRYTVHELKNFPGELYPYQLGGVNWIERCNGRALIADEMGLGKTVQALAWLHLRKRRHRAIIVCPSSLKYNWLEEVRFWLPKSNPVVLEGKNPRPIDPSHDIIIINYAILGAWIAILNKLKLWAFILDEAHYIKNNDSIRTKSSFAVAKSIPNVIALTGTPIENRPKEIFNIAKIVDPTVFPNWWKFVHRYCGAKQGYFGLDTDGATNVHELHMILTSTIMIRRKKKDVLKDLPPKTVSTVSLKIDNVKEYAFAEANFRRYLKEKFDEEIKKKEEAMFSDLEAFMKQQGIKVSKDFATIDSEVLKKLRKQKIKKIKQAPALVQIEILKQLAIQGKRKQIVTWIKEFLESGEKLVVFAIHRETIDALMKEFPKAVKIDGSVKDKKRQETVKRFQTDPKVRLLIGNIKAAGVGLTLTAASNAAIIEFPWSPGELTQAEDRIHRITQSKQVTIHYLVGVGTIELDIIQLLHFKQKVVEDVLDGVYVDTGTLHEELLKKYSRKQVQYAL